METLKISLLFLPFVIRPAVPQSSGWSNYCNFTTNFRDYNKGSCYARRCYWLTNTEEYFWDARQACLNMGGDLASVHSAYEWDALVSSMSGIANRNREFFWIGHYFNYATTQPAWTDGCKYDEEMALHEYGCHGETKDIYMDPTKHCGTIWGGWWRLRRCSEHKHRGLCHGTHRSYSRPGKCYPSAPATFVNTQASDFTRECRLIERFNNPSQFTTSPVYGTETDYTYFGPVMANWFCNVDGVFVYNAGVASEVKWSAINITGLTNIKFVGNFASYPSRGNDVDTNDSVKITASVDGGAPINLLWFYGNQTEDEGYFHQDTDFDGVADGVDFLWGSFEPYIVDVGATGDSMELIFNVSLTTNHGREDVNFDNIYICGDRVTEPVEICPLIETFDDDTKFTVDSNPELFTNGGNTFFEFQPSETMGAKPYTGADGQYLSGMNLAAGRLVTWSGIDISGLTQLKFVGSFAEYFDGADIDTTDHMKLYVSIDGGAEQNVLWFNGKSGLFTRDNDFNGVGEGPETLGTSFQEFIVNLAGVGNSLTLKFRVKVSVTDEDFAIDNFKICGMRGGTTIGTTTPPPTTPGSVAA